MKARLKKFKFFLTFHKEREWLENMALQGYMLEDVKLGMFYCFRKDEPKRMLYEVDRFDLKRNPNLEEMMEKVLYRDNHELRSIDAAPWGAERAWQLYDGEEYRQWYVLCYGDVILEMVIDWDITQEQMDYLNNLFNSRTKIRKR